MSNQRYSELQRCTSMEELAEHYLFEMIEDGIYTYVLASGRIVELYVVNNYFGYLHLTSVNVGQQELYLSGNIQKLEESLKKIYWEDCQL